MREKGRSAQRISKLAHHSTISQPANFSCACAFLMVFAPRNKTCHKIDDPGVLFSGRPERTVTERIVNEKDSTTNRDSLAGGHVRRQSGQWNKYVCRARYQNIQLRPYSEA